MSAATSPKTAERIAPRAERRAVGDVLLSVLPLLAVYTSLCTVYLVEVWGRLTPWLFVDELKATQLARGIAATGHPMQRGERVSPDSLYNYVTAPLWLFHHVATAYAGIKYLDVFLMASAVFPTYFLARLFVGRRAALFAAAGAGAIPSLAYTGYVAEENIAYPYAAFCFFLIAKALLELPRGRRWAIGAGVASVLAPAVRGELAVVPAVYALALLFAVWSSDWAKERRRSWSGGDWAGAVVLALGAIFLVSAVLSSLSQSWQWATQFYKHRMIDQTGWAAGALAVGIGVVPLTAGLAALFRLPGEGRSRTLRLFRTLLLAGLIGFGLYTAVKAAYLSAVFATRVEERNLIYVSPLLFVGMALLLDRRAVNRWALLASGAFVGYLVVYALYHPTQYPYEMNVQLYSDALGLAILQQANRYLAWTPELARWVLLGITLGGLVALGALPSLRRRARLGGALAIVLGAGVVGWTLTGQIAAAAGSNTAGQQAANTLSPRNQPYSWVDDATHGVPTLYEGVAEYDPNSENMLEFWNRSIVSVGSLDGTLGGPGHSGAPNLTRTGTLYWTDSPTAPGRQYAYAVEAWPCVDFAGARAASHWRLAGGQLNLWRLIRLTQPNRLRSSCTGIYPDRWTGTAPIEYFRYADGRGRVRVVVSRPTPQNVPPTAVHVQLGTIADGPDRTPVFGKTVEQRTVTLHAGEAKTVWLPTKLERYAVVVTVDRTWVPHDSIPGNGDTRQLGVQLSFGVRQAAHR